MPGIIGFFRKLFGTTTDTPQGYEAQYTAVASEYDNDFGWDLRRQRILADMSQVAYAHYLGVGSSASSGQQLISRWERGVSLPHSTLLPRLVRHLRPKDRHSLVAAYDAGLAAGVPVGWKEESRYGEWELEQGWCGTR